MSFHLHTWICQRQLEILANFCKPIRLKNQLASKETKLWGFTRCSLQREKAFQGCLKGLRSLNDGQSALARKSVRCLCFSNSTGLGGRQLLKAPQNSPLKQSISNRPISLSQAAVLCQALIVKMWAKIWKLEIG